MFFLIKFVLKGLKKLANFNSQSNSETKDTLNVEETMSVTVKRNVRIFQSTNEHFLSDEEVINSDEHGLSFLNKIDENTKKTYSE